MQNRATKLGTLLSVVMFGLISCASSHQVSSQSSLVAPGAPKESGRAKTPAILDASVGNPVTKRIPDSLIRPLLGCWQLGDQERWHIRRVGPQHAQVRRELLGLDDLYPSYVKRAAIPSRISYNPSEGTFGFPSAGRIHAALLVFRVDGETLEASSFSRRNPRAGYHYTGNTFTLSRCD